MQKVTVILSSVDADEVPGMRAAGTGQGVRDAKLLIYGSMGISQGVFRWLDRNPAFVLSSVL